MGFWQFYTNVRNRLVHTTFFHPLFLDDETFDLYRETMDLAKIDELRDMINSSVYFTNYLLKRQREGNPAVNMLLDDYEAHLSKGNY